MKKQEIKENIENFIVEVTRLVVTVLVTLSVFKVVCETEYKVPKLNASRVSTQENFEITNINTIDNFGIVKTYKDETIDDGETFVKLNKGDWYFELTDGSYGMYKNGQYYFQPVMLGDWVYELKNLEELKNITQTYISMNTYGYF